MGGEKIYSISTFRVYYFLLIYMFSIDSMFIVFFSYKNYYFLVPCLCSMILVMCLLLNRWFVIFVIRV
jgi:hypothetical protein